MHYHHCFQTHQANLIPHPKTIGDSGFTQDQLSAQGQESHHFHRRQEDSTNLECCHLHSYCWLFLLRFLNCLIPLNLKCHYCYLFHQLRCLTIIAKLEDTHLDQCHQLVFCRYIFKKNNSKQIKSKEVNLLRILVDSWLKRWNRFKNSLSLLIPRAFNEFKIFARSLLRFQTGGTLEILNKIHNTILDSCVFRVEFDQCI